MTVRIGILTHEAPGGGPFLGTHCLQEEISFAGHKPIIIDYTRASVAVVDNETLLYERQKQTDEHELVDVDVVIPNLDKQVDAGLLALQALMSQGVVSLQSPEAIRMAENKMSTHIALAQAGVPTPDSIVNLSGSILTEADLAHFDSDADEKVVIKPIDGSRGDHIGLAESHLCAIEQSDMLAKQGVLHFAQEFLKPDRDELPNDKRLVVVDGEVVARMQRHVDPELAQVGEFRTGLSGTGIGTPVIASPELDEMALEACNALDLQYAGVDIQNGTVGDVNPWPGYKIQEIAGVNVAAYVVRFALNLYDEQQGDIACSG